MYSASLSTAASLETFDEKLLGGMAESARAQQIKRVRGEESSGGAYRGDTSHAVYADVINVGIRIVDRKTDVFHRRRTSIFPLVFVFRVMYIMLYA